MDDTDINSMLNETLDSLTEQFQAAASGKRDALSKHNHCWNIAERLFQAMDKLLQRSEAPDARWIEASEQVAAFFCEDQKRLMKIRKSFDDSAEGHEERSSEKETYENAAFYASEKVLQACERRQKYVSTLGMK